MNKNSAEKVLNISAVQKAVAAKRAEKAAQLKDLMHQAESWQRTETEEEIDRKLKEIFQRIMTNDEYNTKAPCAPRDCSKSSKNNNTKSKKNKRNSKENMNTDNNGGRHE